MKSYDVLKTYVYENILDADEKISEETPHFFIKADNEQGKKMKLIEKKLNIVFPSELKDFLLNIGSGQLYADMPDEHIGQYIFLDSQSILGIYDETEDLDEQYRMKRAYAKKYLEEYNLLAFIDFSEESLLFISLDDKEGIGKNSIYYTADNKIADSLEEFVEKILAEPDYFMKEIDEE